MNKYRYRNSWIDLCKDGMFKKERIKGATKKYLSKLTIRKDWKYLENTQEDYTVGDDSDMMTIDEAIDHCKDVYNRSCNTDMTKCPEEHLQLKEWLEELKEYREIYTDISIRPGDTVWVVERDWDDVPFDVSGYVLVAVVSGYVIASPTINDNSNIDYILESGSIDTKHESSMPFSIFDKHDCFKNREDAEEALSQARTFR